MLTPWAEHIFLPTLLLWKRGRGESAEGLASFLCSILLPPLPSPPFPSSLLFSLSPLSNSWSFPFQPI